MTKSCNLCKEELEISQVEITNTDVDEIVGGH